MKIGLVRFFNARPLDFGFLDARRPDMQLIEDTPAGLYESLIAGRLDAALISSVEVLRNHQSLAYCKTVGVCARKEVKSILYIKRRSGPPNPDFYRLPAELVLTDSGSRTSRALLEVLYFKLHNIFVKTAPTPPADIPALLTANQAGVLIGDSALQFQENPVRQDFDVKDLAAWWYERESLPFVFALWAYPAGRPLPDSLFEDSLSLGEANIEKIIARAEFEDARGYLTRSLHYRLDEHDYESLERFREYLAQYEAGRDGGA